MTRGPAEAFSPHGSSPAAAAAAVAAVAIALAVTASGCGGGSSPSRASSAAPGAVSATWSVAQKGTVVEIGYGSGSDFPQYAALHTESGYLRLNYGPASGWGTSVILPPSFWAGGTYHQGTPIAASWRVDGGTLIVSFAGAISSLQFAGEIRLAPPGPASITGAVTVEVSGSAALDPRPGEAFKPVMLSSMHVSATQWDARSATVDAQTFPIPASGWIVQPPVHGRVFALAGGSSAWKANAPTVEITLAENRDITGWVTDSSDPNGDNVGFWAATDVVIRSWQYSVTARP